MVSEVGTAVPIASCSRRARVQSAMMRWVTRGREASWMRTPVSAGSCRDVREGVAYRVRAGGAALDDRADLAADQSLRLIVVSGGHHQEDLVDAGSGGERRDAVLDEGLAVKYEQLLGECRTETGARAAAEYHRHHAFHRHNSGLYPVFEAWFLEGNKGSGLR